MHDPEDEDHVVGLDHVVHLAVVAHTKTVERVAHSLDGLDGLPLDSTLFGGVASKLLESTSKPCLDILRKLPERSDWTGSRA